MILRILTDFTQISTRAELNANTREFSCVVQTRLNALSSVLTRSHAARTEIRLTEVTRVSSRTVAGVELDTILASGAILTGDRLLCCAVGFIFLTGAVDNAVTEILSSDTFR